MIRKLLATTAIAAVLTTGAYAQDSTTTAPAAPAATTDTGTAATGKMDRAMMGNLASNLIGENVYNGPGDDAEKIGDVNDLVVTDSGQVESVIVGVGGFLGLGEKNVAIGFKDLSWVDHSGDRWLVVSATKESLQALPSFDRGAYERAAGTNGAASNTTDPSLSGAAPATTADNANAPAAGGTMNNNMAATPDSAAQATAVDRSTLKEVAPTDLTADNLEGTTVYGANDQTVGEIGDIVLTTDGKVDAVLIDVGGFLGIGEKQVAVGMDKLSFMQDGNSNRYLYTTFTKEQLEAQPAYDAGTYGTQRDQQRLIVQ